jgi:hypothetical protein
MTAPPPQTESMDPETLDKVIGTLFPRFLSLSTSDSEEEEEADAPDWRDYKRRTYEGSEEDGLSGCRTGSRWNSRPNLGRNDRSYGTSPATPHQ